MSVLSFGAVWRRGRSLHNSAGSVLTSHFGVAQPVAWRAGLWRSGRRRSADHDRRSLRERAQMQAGQGKVQVSGNLGGLRQSLSG